MTGPIQSPLDLLLPYQRAWADDAARFKIGLMARQVGKSFACAAEAVRDCLVRPGELWVILSAGERQALEFMLKAREWALAFELAVEDYIEDRAASQALLKAAEIRFPKGSRLLALPANPDTARGYSGNLILDEFAFHDDSNAIWRAIYPSISNPLRGKKKLRIVSTPNGRGNKFYDLWTKNESYTKHRITIHDAVAQGLPIDIDELKEGLDDNEGWAAEYECEFTDAGGVLLAYELIQRCEDEAAREDGQGPDDGAPRYVGVDLGTASDPTVAWTLERREGRLVTVEVLVIPRMDLTPQMSLLRPRLARAARACLDKTGLGQQMGQDFEREFGGKVEAVTFTPQLKREIFPAMKKAFQDRAVAVPISRDVREDLHAYQESFASGAANYWAPRSAAGHSDRCTALALALKAATSETTCGVW